MNGSAVRLNVQGRVQGVYFRATTQSVARELGLAGWVRNCPDGSVEVFAQGEQGKIKTLIAWCHQGSPAASVSSIQVDWVEAENLESFEIR